MSVCVEAKVWGAEHWIWLFFVVGACDLFDARVYIRIFTLGTYVFKSAYVYMIYVGAYIYIYIYRCVYTYICRCVHTCMDVHINTHTLCTTYAPSHTRHVHTCIHTHQARTYMLTYTLRKYVHTHIHTMRRRRWKRRSSSRKKRNKKRRRGGRRRREIKSATLKSLTLSHARPFV